jgi:hypothetical protein
VADLLPIEVDPLLARATVETVPFWLHTFALNRAEGIYTPSAAREHRYRVAALPQGLRGACGRPRGIERSASMHSQRYRA